MPFEPSPDGRLVCTLCGESVPATDLIEHVCVPAAVRAARAAAGPAAPAQSPPPPPTSAEAILGGPPAIPPLTDEPPPGGAWGAQARADGDVVDPIVFRLAGIDFRGVEELSLGVQMDVAKAYESNVLPAAALVELIRGIVHPDDEARFEQVIYSKTIRIDAEELRDALVSVVRAIAGRPSRRSSASPGGPSTTGPTSAGS